MYEQGPSSTEPREPEERVYCAEEEFPSDPLERLSALVSAINMGPKAVALLSLPPVGEYAELADINRSFKRAHKGTPVAAYQDGQAAKYCSTLSTIGLVAQEISVESGGVMKIIGFGLTEAGKQYGRPAAAQFLLAEKELGISLYQVMGTGHTRGERRSPFSRTQILLFLFDHPGEEMSVVKFADHFGLDETERKTMSRLFVLLGELGAIKFTSLEVKTHKGISHYVLDTLPRSQVTSVADEKTLTPIVVDICEDLHREGEVISNALVAQRLALKVDKSVKLLHARAAAVLHGLRSQGYLRRLDRFDLDQSFASLTPLGQKIVQEYLLPLVVLVKDDPYVLEIMNNEVLPEVTTRLSDYAHGSAELYHPFSMSNRRSNTRDTQRAMISLITQCTNPQGITAREIANTVGVSVDTVRLYLRRHGSAYGIKVEKRNDVKYFSH